jgi:hypothetical protein
MKESQTPKWTGLFGFVLLAIFLAAQVAAATDYYVSPSGDDRNPGTGSSKQQAFRTLQRGVDALQPSDTLLIEAGTYRETVRFPRSGLPGGLITVKPDRDQQVTVTGSDPVTGWTPYKGHIWKARMDWTLGRGKNQVFYGGEPMIEARYPKQPSEGGKFAVSGLSPLWPTLGDFAIPNNSLPGRITSALLKGQPDNYWKGACYYGLNDESWGAQSGIIESSKSGEIVVGQRTHQWWFPAAPDPFYWPPHGRGMIFGHLHALDEAREWDWQDGTLYFWAPGNGKPVEQVEAKRRQLAFDFSGRSYIRVEGIHVKAASATLRGASYVTLDHCEFLYVSHFMVFDDARNGAIDKVGDPTPLHNGEVGIYLSGHDNAILNSTIRFSAGAGVYLDGYHQTVHNNWIDQISYTSTYLAPIMMGVSEDFYSGGHTITYNTLSNSGRALFHMDGNVGTRDGEGLRYAACLFAHNHLFNGMLQSRDGGVVNSWNVNGGAYNGTTFEMVNNVIHDGWDIDKLGIVYLDNGSQNFHVAGNLLWASPGSVQNSHYLNPPCINCVWDDNSVLDAAPASVERIDDASFPDGKPFQFGHNFANPPERPEWPLLVARLLEAKASSGHSDGVQMSESGVSEWHDRDWIQFRDVDLSAGCRSIVARYAAEDPEMNSSQESRQPPRHQKATEPLIFAGDGYDQASPGVANKWGFAKKITNGGWLRYNQVPFGDGYRNFRVVYGSDNRGEKYVEMRLDGLEGPLAAKVPLDFCASYDITGKRAIRDLAPFVEKVIDLGDVRGTHDVYFVFHADNDREIGQFSLFRLEGYKGNLGLQPDELRIEVRLGRRDGEKIGDIYPVNTNGAFRETIVQTVRPVPSYRGDVFLVMRSAEKKFGCKLDWVSLETAR